MSKNTVIKTQVCIVGAGAAGITLARELAGQRIDICLLESGGLYSDEETQDLYAGGNMGRPYFRLDMCRLRYFGGSTNHWGGFCCPLEATDFDSREWVPGSGWPFTKAHLDSYYERAQTICQLGPYDYDPKTYETVTQPVLPLAHDRVVTRCYQFSRTNFGRVYKDEIQKARNIDTYLYANVVDIEAHGSGRQVMRVRVATLQGNQFFVAAKLFVLATGGIENARLLLLSNSTQRAGLGNQHDLVGRYFMEHLHLHSGTFILSDPQTSLSLYQAHVKIVRKRSVIIQGFLALAPEIARRESLLGFSATLEPRHVHGKQYSSGNFTGHVGEVVTDFAARAAAQ